MLRLQFLTLIVPRSTFARCQDLPRFFGGLNAEGGILFETSWYDEHLWCETAMNGSDLDGMIQNWETRGLRVKDAEGRWADMCVCASQKGPLAPCPWLRFDPDQNTVWLEGTEPGPSIGGADQIGELEAELTRQETAGEAAYAAMYEAWRPKDDYEDALLGLGRALEAARMLHRGETAARLEARLVHVRSVYDHQMRGF